EAGERGRLPGAPRPGDARVVGIRGGGAGGGWVGGGRRLAVGSGRDRVPAARGGVARAEAAHDAVRVHARRPRRRGRARRRAAGGGRPVRGAVVALLVRTDRTVAA